MNGDRSHRPNWPELLQRAAGIVESYDTSVTLRQLFYRLVAAQVLPNTQNSYKSLSRYTAEARRSGTFPALIDRGRSIHRPSAWDGPADALQSLVSQYRRDRTEGQEVSVYLGIEKAGIVEQLQEWFGDLGVPVLALGGYGSQSYVDEVARDVRAAVRPAVLLYAGDYDPSGEDIDRDFVQRTDCWNVVRRVALTEAQVTEYELPPQPGKETAARAGLSSVTGSWCKWKSMRSRPRCCAGCSWKPSRSFGTAKRTGLRLSVRAKTGGSCKAEVAYEGWKSRLFG